MNIARQNLQPAIIPVWTCMEIEVGKNIGVIKLAADSPEKPYKARRGRAWVTFIRAASTSQEATREEEGRLYQAVQLGPIRDQVGAGHRARKLSTWTGSRTTTRTS